jgi:hypothetical protein
MLEPLQKEHREPGHRGSNPSLGRHPTRRTEFIVQAFPNSQAFSKPIFASYSFQDVFSWIDTLIIDADGEYRRQTTLGVIAND